MKFYDFDAPNPQKVRIYAAEKGIELNCVPVAVLEGELHKPEMLAKNPLAQVPFLELDNGEIIRESLVIIEYLEALHPEPAMIGSTPIERARIQQLDRLAELGILMECANYVHHSHPFFESLGPQSSEGAEMARLMMNKKLTLMDSEIAGRSFVAGDQLSIADCTLFATVGFVRKYGPGVPEGLKNLARWERDFSLRPSASA
ncbi:MAG: glutathione S-transferase family protein [Pseudomonadota bacterium]